MTGVALPLFLPGPEGDSANSFIAGSALLAIGCSSFMAGGITALVGVAGSPAREVGPGEREWIYIQRDTHAGAQIPGTRMTSLSFPF